MRDGLAITHASDRRVEIEVTRAMLGAEAVERSTRFSAREYSIAFRSCRFSHPATSKTKK